MLVKYKYSAVVQFVHSEATWHQSQMYTWSWQVVDGEDFSFRVFWPFCWREQSPSWAIGPCLEGADRHLHKGVGWGGVGGLLEQTGSIRSLVICTAVDLQPLTKMSWRESRPMCSVHLIALCNASLSWSTTGCLTPRGWPCNSGSGNIFWGCSLEEFLFPAARNDPPLSLGYVSWINDSQGGHCSPTELPKWANHLVRHKGS